MNTTPSDERNPKNAPSQSDSRTKPRPFQAPYNTQPYRGGGGGHTSERENIAPQRKEPVNTPDATPIMSKGVLMQYKKRAPKQRIQGKTAISGHHHNAKNPYDHLPGTTRKWRARWDSNPWSPAPEAGALSTLLRAHRTKWTDHTRLKHFHRPPRAQNQAQIP